jgi:HPt (histidine-containing phosphotransfer) domain-containing protein
MNEELHAAHAARAADRFRRAAHSLKSNSNTFGAKNLGAMARALELGEVPVDDVAIDTVAAEYQRVAAALAELCNG